MNSKSPGICNRLKQGNWLSRLVYGLCVILVIADLFSHGHNQHPWEKLPAFYALFGLLGCLGLAMLAKLLARLIKRNEDYYD